MSASSEGGISSSGGKLRVAIRIISGGVELGKLRLALDPSSRISSLEQQVRPRLAQLPEGSLVQRIEGEDGSELFGQDVLEDVFEPGETLQIHFTSPAPPPPPLAVVIKRLVSGASDTSIAIDRASNTPVAQLKKTVESLTGMPSANMNLSLGTRILEDGDVVQSLAEEGQVRPLVLFCFMRVATSRVGGESQSGQAAGAGVSGQGEPVTITYRTACSDQMKTIVAGLDDTLASLKRRIAAAERADPPPRALLPPPVSPVSPTGQGQSKQAGSGEKLIDWIPRGSEVALARRSHFMYSTPQTDAKSLREWGFADDKFVFVLLVGSRELGSAIRAPDVGYMESFTASPAWAPWQCFQQTNQGMACFLSALYVFCDKLRSDNEAAGKVNAHLRRLTGFDPACLALHCLIRKRALGPLEKAALASAFYRVARQLAPAEIADRSVFEASRSVLYYLHAVLGAEDVTGLVRERYRSKPLECPITLRRLEDPVFIVRGQAAGDAAGPSPMDLDGGPSGDLDIAPPRVFSREAAQACILTKTNLHLLGVGADETVDFKTDDVSRRLLLAYPLPSMLHAEVWEGLEGVQNPPPPTGVDVSGSVDWPALLRTTKHMQEMAVVRPLALSRARPPCLTLDVRATVCVYLGRSGKGQDVNKSTSLFRPLVSGHPEAIDRNEIAQAVAKLLQEDEANALSAGLQEDREPDEAIVVLLDTSNSMNRTSFTETKGAREGAGSGDEEEEEEVEEEEDEMDLDDVEAEGPARIPHFPAAPDVPCPHELICPLTQGIMLDPVVASDGQTYERKAIARWISEKSSWFSQRIASPVGRGQIDSTVELRPNMDMKLRVERWLREGYPVAMLSEGGACGGAAAATPAPVPMVQDVQPAGSAAVKAEAEPFTLSVASSYTAPTPLPNTRSSDTLSSVMSRWLAEVQLPPSMPFTHMRITYRYRQLRVEDMGKTLAELGVKPDYPTIKLAFERPQGVARSHLPVVVHLGNRKKEGGMEHNTSLLVRGDVTAKKLMLHLRDIGYLGVRKASQQGFWHTFTYAGDSTYVGYVLDANRQMWDFSHSFKPGEGYELEVDGVSHLKKKKKGAAKAMTRLEVVKQLFEAFINRCEAYDNANEIALVLFGTSVTEACPLTNLLENFRESVTRCKAGGDTSLYDALEHAAGMLRTWKKDHPKARLRILCLSDGEDTHSRTTSVSVAGLLQNEDVIVDSILIGSAENRDLLGISKATGGYCFKPDTLRDALKLNELETLLSSLMRAPIEGPLRRVSRLSDLQFHWRLPLDVCNDLQVPPARPHPGLSQRAMSLDAALARTGTTTTTTGSSGSSGVGGEVASAMGGAAGGVAGSGAMRRLVREMQALKGPEAHPAFIIMPSTDDLLFWRLILTAPQGSLYEGGTFLLYMEFPVTFPMEPPVVRFVTPILHCNVNPYGRICHSILDRNWTVDTKISVILGCIYGLLLNPDTADPLDADLAQKFYAADGGYEASIMAHTETHAKGKTAEQLRKEMEADDEAAEGATATPPAAQRGRTVTEVAGGGGLRRSKRKSSNSSR